MNTDAKSIAHIDTPLTSPTSLGQRLTKRRQRGVTLVELSVAVAVMGLIMAGAMVGVPRLMNSVKLSQEMKDWQMSALAVQNAVASGTLKVSLPNDEIRKLAIAEPFNKPEGNTSLILNRFGGAVTFTGVDGSTFPSSGVKVTSVGYPSAQCEEFAAKMNGLFSTLSINGTVIKSGAQKADISLINGACTTKGTDPAAQADLDFTIAG